MNVQWIVVLKVFVVVFWLFCASINTSLAAATQQETDKHTSFLVFGILPIVSPEQLVRRFGPLADYLGKKLGVEIRIETAPNYKEFVKRTNQQQRYDILLTAPHFYYLARHKAGYRSLVRVDRPVMQMLIVVPVHSDIRKVRDLAGRRLAIVDPLALGTMLVREHFLRSGLDPDRDVTLVTTPNHNNSLLAAYKGLTDASALMVSPFMRAKPEIRKKMRIIDRTMGTPTLPISVAPWVSHDRAELIMKILLSLGHNQHGKALLKHIGWPGFVPVQPEEYDVLKSIAQQVPLN